LGGWLRGDNDSTEGYKITGGQVSGNPENEKIIVIEDEVVDYNVEPRVYLKLRNGDLATLIGTLMTTNE